VLSNRRALLAAALLTAVLPGCGRRQQDGVRRVAVVAFDNQSGDAALDWQSRGIADGIVLALTGSPRSAAVYVPALAGAFASRPTHIIHGYISARGRAHAAVEDATTHRIVAEASASGPSAAAIAQELARRIEPSARPLNISDEALRAFSEGSFERAASLEPAFGAAYTGWATAALAKGDRAAAEKAIAAGLARGESIGALERAQLQLAAARLSGDRAATRRALLSLTQAAPADAAAFRALAPIDTGRRSFADAARWYDEAIARDPDPDLYNAAAYVRAYGGDLEGAVNRIEIYRRLRPNEANPLDSRGEIHYHLGRFAEAERDFLASFEKDPSFLGGAALYKAAWARLRTGDLAGADAHMARYLKTLSGERAAVLQAQWEFVTGRREQAFKRLANAQSPAAAAHLAVWSLESGDRALAATHVARVPMQSAAGAALRLVLAPESQGATGPVADLARGYAAMLAGRPHEAVRHFSALLDAAQPGSADGPEVLLAWALAESGRAEEAKPLLAHNPIPDASGDHLFLPLIYPRLLELRQRLGMAQSR
jgi:tetratricopeptide (TPR) repeat protein